MSTVNPSCTSVYVSNTPAPGPVLGQGLPTSAGPAGAGSWNARAGNLQLGELWGQLGGAESTATNPSPFWGRFLESPGGASQPNGWNGRLVTNMDPETPDQGPTAWNKLITNADPETPDQGPTSGNKLITNMDPETPDQGPSNWPLGGITCMDPETADQEPCRGLFEQQN